MIISNGTPIAPQALGELVPTFSNGYYYAQSGIDLIQKVATYGALYRAQPAVAMVVDKLASAAARLTIKVWDITPEGGRVLDTTSPYAKLIARPSQFLSPFAFWRWVFSTYEVYGEAFLLKLRNASGELVELIPMHPSRVAVKRDQEGRVWYTFSLGVGQTGVLTVGAEDVVPFLRWNTDNLMRGLSRLEPLRTTLANEDAIRRANGSFWKNGARPSLVLSHPKNLSQPAVDRLGKQIQALQSGADNMGRPLILEEGLTALPQQLNSEEMQYIESRKLNREEVCGVYDVPPPVVHILDHATFSNITEQMRSMYRDTMTPRLEDGESVIDMWVRPEFADDGTREAKFDMDDVLRGDFESRVDKAVSLRNAGIVTGNQALEIIGMQRSDDPKMDAMYANAALVPLGSNGRTPVSTEGEIIPTALAAREVISVRSVMGRLGQTKSHDLRTKLVDEHKRELRGFFDRQRESIKSTLPLKASGVFDAAAWDDELSGILGTLSTATSQAVGTKTATGLDGTYDPGRLSDWIDSNAKTSATKINQTTAAFVAAALEPDPEDDTADDAVAIDDLFDGEISARADQIALTRVAVVAGIASLVAAEMNNAATKTWQVTSANPRPEHASMDGETVALGELFSNGMNGPGDPSGGADEVAGCTCDLTFGKD